MAFWNKNKSKATGPDKGPEVKTDLVQGEVTEDKSKNPLKPGDVAEQYFNNLKNSINNKALGGPKVADKNEEKEKGDDDEKSKKRDANDFNEEFDPTKTEKNDKNQGDKQQSEEFGQNLDEAPIPEKTEEEKEQEDEEKQEQEEEEQEQQDGNSPNDKNAPDGRMQKLRQLYEQNKKKIADWTKKNFSKDGMKAAGQMLVKFLAANWYWVLLIVIGLLLLILLLSSCTGLGGKTPPQYPDPKKPADQELVLEVQAKAGEPSAQRQLIDLKAQKITTKIDALTPGIKELEWTSPISSAILVAQALDAAVNTKIAQAAQLAQEISLVTESDNAVFEKTKQLKELLVSIKTDAPELSGQIDEIISIIDELDKTINSFKKAQLVINPIDIEYIREYKVDVRVLKMLNYLVTPKDQNGAGYERIKVKRIVFSYDTERKSLSKETEYETENEKNISAHFSGQAVDITEIDNIKCTEIKRRRVGGSKKRKLPPTPIKVAWQTDKGYMSAGGPEAYGQNMHQISSNLAAGAINDVLAQQIADIVGVDLDITLMKGMSLAEATRYVGIAVLKQELDIPGDYEMGSSIEEILNGVGRAYLAEALAVPFESLEGDGQAEILANIGQGIVEDRIGLPAGSLSGNTSEQVMFSIGQRKMETSLKLSKNSLAVNFDSADSFKRVVGQGRVEAALGLTAQSFYGSSINDVKDRIGNYNYQSVFGNPELLDNVFGISPGTTKRLNDGSLSPDGYNMIVGQKVFEQQIAVYKDPVKRAAAFGATYVKAQANVTGRDDIGALINGNANAFILIGQTTLAQTATVSEEERTLIISWLASGIAATNLDVDYLGGQYGMQKGDMANIFVNSLPRMTFYRIGTVHVGKVVVEGITSSSTMSTYVEYVQDITFYTNRLKIIDSNLEDLEKNPATSAKAREARAILSEMLRDPTKQSIDERLKNLQTKIKELEEADDGRGREKINAIKKAIFEIIEGKEITDLASYNPASSKVIVDKESGLTKKDVIDVAIGRQSIGSVAARVGLVKWETELNLPPGTLSMAYNEIRQGGNVLSDEVLFVSLGKARVEEIGKKSNEQSDQIFGLQAGTTAEYRSGKITEKGYYKLVGQAYMQNYVATRLLNKQLGLDNSAYALNGNDMANMFNGGWFQVALKIGGRMIDEVFDFPQGGTLDILSQNPQTVGNFMEALGAKKLGQLAGLNRAVSLEGNIINNLGLAKIEQELHLKVGELTADNLTQKVRDFTSSNEKSLEMLDISLNISRGDSKKLIDGAMEVNDYLQKVGNGLRNGLIYDQLTRFSPELAQLDLKDAVLALANGTGSASDILEAAGANRLGELLGIDYPVSIRGNFKNNLGQAKIEDRLGLKKASFKGTIDDVVRINGQEKFEAAFNIVKGQFSNTAIPGSPYWLEPLNKNKAAKIDALLNLPTESTYKLLVRQLSIEQYAALAGEKAISEIATDKLMDLLEIDPSFKDALSASLKIFRDDPSLSTATQAQLFDALTSVAGLDLDSQTGFEKGTWKSILFEDPANPAKTGLDNAGDILLEQGFKYLTNWISSNDETGALMYVFYTTVLNNNQSAFGSEAERYERQITEKIMEATGIPVVEDAKLFLQGDFKGGITAVGAAKMLAVYNEEFGEGEFALKYEDIKIAYFNDLTTESAIADQYVAAQLQQARAQSGSSTFNFSPDMEKQLRETAVREYRDKIRKEVQYKMMDAALHQVDKNIPAGFVQAMREGTDFEKWNMGATYLGNWVNSANPDIPAELLPDLQKYFDKNSPDYQNISALSDASFGFLDGKMKEIFGDFVQPGTAKALLNAVKTGSLGSVNDVGSLANIYVNYGISVVTKWADKALGLPSGTTMLIYQSYQQYTAAYNALKQAQVALALAEKAGQGIEAAKQALSAQSANMANVKALIITAIITYAFQEELAALDEALGLVPGSSAMAVGIGVDLLIKGAANPWMVGMFIAMNLFGVYRIDIVCSACGYYPQIDDTVRSGWGFKKIIPASGQSCPLKDFDGKNEKTYQKNTVLAAQYKVKMLLGDLMQMHKKLNDEEMLPTQIMTLRQEDVQNFATESNAAYGPPSTRLNKGIWANEVMWDRIHIGY